MQAYWARNDLSYVTGWKSQPNPLRGCWARPFGADSRTTPPRTCYTPNSLGMEIEGPADLSSDLPAAAMDDDPNLSMKLLIDHEGRRVLFAEAGKDAVDILFSILSLPLGAVARIKNWEDRVWSIGNLYQNFLVNKVVATYPNTANANSPPLLLSTNQSSPTEKSYYKCANFGYSSCRSYVTLDPKSVCPYCSTAMSSPLTLVSPTNEGSSSSSSSSYFESGFVKDNVTYMIMDDLVVKPMSIISSITLFNRLNLKRRRSISPLSIDKVGKLLSAALQTKKVLTNVFFEEKMVVEEEKSLESVE
ncbi:uncharacterized protein LOC119981261 [Tripterygium wilfordii]|uniref:uncharacterized protein LOC119981261 n=1 Tax=Tripterygium wilfordii TaxID=458696 RepID=UPI0018F862A4|nr:uncharacterized protein LOC119981261 [Tripterygium wilfordii]